MWKRPNDLLMLEIRAKLADLGLNSFVRGRMVCKREHVRISSFSKR